VKTLAEFRQAVLQVREALNQMKIEATSENCGIALFCHKKLDEMVAGINEAIKTAPPGDIEIRFAGAEKEESMNGDDR
jgi:ABC-type uncharacterized transport system substrate-binding protein